jgi:membrane protein DedA with SNARE-associated domain
LLGLFGLILVTSIIKTIAAGIWYLVADKTEDVVVGNYGKKFGISHQRLENIGRKLSKGLGDELAILILRAVPVIPTSMVSIMAGFIKLNMKSFLWTTFLGMMIRNTLYVLVGIGALELVI